MDIHEESSKKEESSKTKERRRLFDRLIPRQRAQQGLLLIAVLYTLYFARSLFLPIFIAILIAAFLQPFMQKLTRLKIPEFLAAGVVLVVFTSIVLVTLYGISTPAVAWLNRGPAAFREVERKISTLKESIQKAKKTTERLEGVAKVTPGEKTEVVVKGPSLGEKFVGSASLVLSQAALIFILVFFLLSQGRRLLGRIMLAFRQAGEDEGFAQSFTHLQQDISFYLRTITIINVSLGISVGLAMAAVGMPNPALWAVVTTIFNFVPYLGPVVTFGIVCIVSLLTFETWSRIILAPVVFVVLRSLEGEVITPIILGSRLSMNPIVIFLSILFWGWVWGIPGIFLAVPTLVTLRVLSSHIEILKPLGTLLSQGSP